MKEDLFLKKGPLKKGFFKAKSLGSSFEIKNAL